MTEWLMVVLTFIYVICTVVILWMNYKQNKNQKEQIEIFLTKEKNNIIKRYIILALICISRRHKSEDNEQNKRCTAVEIHNFLLEKKFINKNQYTYEDIFYLCLELNSEGQVYFRAPESIERIGDGELKIDMWEFSKRAIK